MKTFALLLALTQLAAIAAPPVSSLQFVAAPGLTALGQIPLPNGSVAVFGAVNSGACTVASPGSCNQTETPLLSILNVSGSQTAALASSALGSGNSRIEGAALDANGNFWIAGETDSDDFPLVHALFTQKSDYKQIGFLAKLNANFDILFSTYLGGQPALGQTSVVGVALDGAGNPYVVGMTNDANFVTTGPVFGAGVPFNDQLNPRFYAFVLKVSSSGSNVLFSRLLGGDQPFKRCTVCPDGIRTVTRPYALAVGLDGSLAIGGSTNASNFPITANVYQGGSGAFVSRISADGSQLVWSTELGIPSLLSPVPTPGFVQSVALDSANNVYLTGYTFQPIPTTPGAIQSQAQIGPTGGNGFVVKLSSDATRLLFATNLTATVAGVTLDSAGNAWITGDTIYSTTNGKVNATNFPGLSNIPPSGLDFALELNADASAIQQIFTFLPPSATQAPAFDSDGNLLLLASAGNLVRLNAASALTAAAVFAITNSAIQQAAANMTPGELVTFYGVGLGPSTGIAGAPDQNGHYPTQLGGVTVKINNVAAPLLYVGPNQINLQVPFLGALGPNLLSSPAPYTVVVTTPTGTLSTLQPQTLGSVGIFGVVNSDGTINNATHPAPAGSTVMVFLTGLGAPSPSELDGAISQSANSAFLTKIEVKWPYLPLGVSYAGTAPSLINGLDQVNVILPPGIKGLQLVVQTLPEAGLSATSNIVNVYAQ